MQITWYSPAFHPMIGGLETVVEVLSGQFALAGHKVTIITNALNPQPDDFPFQVLRRPSWLEQIRVIRRSDVFLHANISLWGVIPWLLCGPGRPALLATHQGWYAHFGRPQNSLDRLKVWLTRNWAVNISASQAVDSFLELQGHVIPNPYDSRLFRLLPNVQRNRDLVFLGRLVSDKGCDLILDALVLLRDRGQAPSLTIIGSGPDREKLEQQVENHQLQSQVQFTGPQSGEALVHLLNQHRIMVVPSRWNEPFGIVALEGIACGCAVIGTKGGGLPEAIGPCGTTFPNDDAQALATLLLQALTGSLQAWTDPLITQPHLARHHATRIAQAYLDVIQSTFE